MGEREDLESLRRRVRAALVVPGDELPGALAGFMPSPADAIRGELSAAAAGGGIAGMRAALDTFDRLAETHDHGVSRRALLLFLTHHPLPRSLGIRIPSYLERHGAALAARDRKRGV